MNIQEKKQFQGALILSTLLHFIIVGLFYFGLPSVFEKLPEEKDVLTFEVVPVSAIANIKTENKSTQKEKIAEKSKEIKASKPFPKKQATPPKKIIEKEEPKKEKEIVPAKEKAKPKKAPPKKVEVQEQEEDPWDSIYKNIDKKSEGTEAKTPTKSHEAKEQSNKTARGAEYNEEYPLSETEKSYITKIIKKHWRQPTGSEFTDIKIKIEMTLEKNGKIISSKVTEEQSSNEYAKLRKLAIENMERALKQIDTIEGLSSERYNHWKTLILYIDPGSF
jgi:outer membrane biosynthesis protein TonB